MIRKMYKIELRHAHMKFELKKINELTCIQQMRNQGNADVIFVAYSLVDGGPKLKQFHST